MMTSTRLIIGELDLTVVRRLRAVSRYSLAIAVALVLLSCGGGGGGDSGSAAPPAGGGNPPANPGPTPPGGTPPDVPPVVTPPSGSLPETVLSFNGAVQPNPSPIVRAEKSALLVTAIAFDSTRSQILAATILNDGSAALTGLNPADLSVVWTAPLSSPASVLAVSDDGSMAYAGLVLESAIQQINLAAHTSVRTFAVAPPDSGVFAFDIAVRPGAPETIAAALGTHILVPASGLPSLFVQGVQKPTTGNPHDGANSRVTFLDASTLITIDNETNEFDIQKYSVTDDGLTYAAYFPNVCCGSQVRAVNGKLFSSSGTFFDPATLKPVKSLGTDAQDMKLYHPGTSSVIQMFAADSGVTTTAQLSFREFDAERGYLKRLFRADEAIPGANPGRVVAFVLDAVVTGPSSFAVLVGDELSGFTALLSFDLSAFGPLQPRSLDPRSALAENVSALAIPLAFNSFAYDAAADRVVVAVQAMMGPQGNSLAIVKPGDGAVERLIPLPDEPRLLAVSQSGSIAYAVLKDGTIQQVDLASATLGLRMGIELPNLQPPIFYPLPTAQFFPTGITVKPDDPQTFAIAGCASLAGYTCGETVAVFRNGAQNGIFGPRMFIPGELGFPLSDALVFNGPAEILGFDESTTTPTIQHFSYANPGLSAVSSKPGPNHPAKIGFGYAYSAFSLFDIQTDAQVGTFVPGASDVSFFDATLLMSSTSGIGSYQHPLLAGGSGLFFELLAKATKPDGSIIFSAPKRLRVNDTAFTSSLTGPLIAVGANRFAYGIPRFDGTGGGIYIISPP